jgi:predicted ATPase
VFIERAEALGEPPEDPLLLFSVLSGFWSASYVAFNGDAILDLAAQVLALAEKQGSTVPLMIGYPVTGLALLHTGDIAGARAHLDRAIALYDPATHRPLAPRFVQDIRVTALAYRSFALWLLGYPVASLADVAVALKDAREISHAGSLMFALAQTGIISVLCGDFLAAIAQADECFALAESKSPVFLETIRKDPKRLRDGPDQRQSLGSSSNDYLWTQHCSVDRCDSASPAPPIVLG